MNRLQQAIKFIELDKWDDAHALVQDGASKSDYLIHGLLHRIEGDMPNARYWYSQAGEVVLENAIDDEIKRVKTLINND
ncbi:hypothetical protein RS130_13380 [Paraglaciecola aquimarina]|uniref:Uncharacterized protein n=1 Tax=Paraglaciecola aquimarina TaxID=1235557 RepID=A0ABU3SXN2_9ALTE|nr:hypothetical protein [Paraglaciecola aquimarina]MDU0354778.1 hypothetical protein [Paraglaciecola aquimarina]